MQQVSVTQRITKVLTLFITYVFLIVMALICAVPVLLDDYLFPEVAG